MTADGEASQAQQLDPGVIGVIAARSGPQRIVGHRGESAAVELVDHILKPGGRRGIVDEFAEPRQCGRWDVTVLVCPDCERRTAPAVAVLLVTGAMQS